MTGTEGILRKVYTAFNERDIDAVFRFMHPGVDWPNGWEGGYVKGHEEVRAYWTRQWKEIDPKVEPVTVLETKDGRFEVSVHQVVKDLDGNLLFDGPIKHIYTFEGNLVVKMEIEKV